MDLYEVIKDRDHAATARERGLHINKYADPVIGIAIAIAEFAHTGQVRKYTGEPYINHPIAVAKMVLHYFPDVSAVCAAILHDVVEDSAITIEDLSDSRLGLGQEIVRLVDDLTDISTPEVGNRKARKAMDRAHTANAHPIAKLVKLADLLDNSRSITEHDPKFAKVYLAEKSLLLTEALLFHHNAGTKLEKAHNSLWKLAIRFF